jgi:hypothetical protein
MENYAGMVIKENFAKYNIGYRERLEFINSSNVNGSPAKGNLDFRHGGPPYCFENFSD